MSDLLLSRIDTGLVYPPFLARLRALLEDAESQEHSYWVIEGYRSYGRSDVLFAQGRTSPGKVVTNARGGQSAHNFGIAADLVRDGFMERAGLQPDYRPPSYDLLGVLAPKHGLVWGGSWAFRDLPHVQVPMFVTSADIEPLRQAFAAGGLSAVWRVLDQRLVFPVPAV